MAINYAYLRTLPAQKLIGALRHDGFELDRSSPPNYLYRHPDGRRVGVTYDLDSDTFPSKTLQRMIEVQAGWGESDLARLLGTLTPP